MTDLAYDLSRSTKEKKNFYTIQVRENRQLVRTEVVFPHHKRIYDETGRFVRLDRVNDKK